MIEKQLGVKKALLVTSCTHALEAAAILINIKPGDEVIVPSYTFVSTALAFQMRGAKIIFADEWKHIDPGLQKGLFKKDGGRIGFRKGGTDKKWMQKVSASIKKRGTKGKCTPITKPGCTGRAKALAKTFKKIAAKRKA